MSRRMGLLGGDKVAVSPILNENEWDVISTVSTAGEAANFWSVGDCKEIVLNGTVGNLMLSNYTVCVFIIGFDHNSTYEGANRIHFQLGKTALSGGTDVALCDSKYGNTGSDAAFRMNTKNTNSGGWNNSYMRKTICPAFKNVLPAALKNAIKSVTKYTDNTGNSSAASAVTATIDEIFLLAEHEVFGSRTYANQNETTYQAQYAYYSAGNSKIKYNHSATSTAVTWWLRSPHASDSSGFVSVNYVGRVASFIAIWSYGFAPGFCV